MDEKDMEQQMRERYEMQFGPGSWERVQEKNRLREEEYRRQEEIRLQRLAEEENRRKLWLQYQEERGRKEYLYYHSKEVFMKEKEGFCFDRSGTISSQTLYDLYDRWCTKQGIFPETPRVFLGWLKEDGANFRIRPCQNIPTPDGRRVRGFRGIRLAEEAE